MNPAQEGRMDVLGIPDFWVRLCQAEVKCLVLDYDGTLAPFQVDRRMGIFAFSIQAW